MQTVEDCKNVKTVAKVLCANLGFNDIVFSYNIKLMLQGIVLAVSTQYNSFK